MRAVARTQALLHGGAGQGATLAQAVGEQDRACRLAGLRLNLTPGLNTNLALAGALDATEYARTLAGDYSRYASMYGGLDIENDDGLWYGEDIWTFMSCAVDVLGSPAAPWIVRRRQRLAAKVGSLLGVVL